MYHESEFEGGAGFKSVDGVLLQGKLEANTTVFRSGRRKFTAVVLDIDQVCECKGLRAHQQSVVLRVCWGYYVQSTYHETHPGCRASTMCLPSRWCSQQTGGTDRAKRYAPATVPTWTMQRDSSLSALSPCIGPLGNRDPPRRRRSFLSRRKLFATFYSP